MGQPQRNEDLTSVGKTAGSAYTNLMSDQTPLEKEYIPQSQQMWNNYMTGVDQNMQDYGSIMGGYQDFSKGLGGPTKFSYQSVGSERPTELGQAYGYLNEAMPGYREFAKTGGYSPTDIQELRARGVSPIRTAYSNTMMEMDRARALGGAGGAPNYIAAASKAQRELPGQMADAMTTVNAGLADAIRQGKIQGLSGMTNVGSQLGGLSSQEAGRMLQAAMSNQNADLQAQQLSEQSLQNLRQSQLASLSGQTNLYGTTPAMSAMFGNQALQAYQNRINLEQQRNNLGLGLIDAQLRAYGAQTPQTPGWQQALNAAGSVLPYVFPNKTTTTTQPGQTGPQGPQGEPGVSVNTPVTPPNWYNNAPAMGQVNAPQTNIDSNWYVAGQQPASSYNLGGDQGYYNPSMDPFFNTGNWFGYGPVTNGQQFSGWGNFDPEFAGNNVPLSEWGWGQQTGPW